MPAPSSALSGVTPQLHRLAALWKRVAVEFAEQQLALAKSVLFDLAPAPADVAAISQQERDLAHLRQLDGAPLVCEFAEWRRTDPEFTQAMIRTIAARDRYQLHVLAEGRP